MLIVETFEQYHMRRADHLTSHSLADYRFSPRLYRRRKDHLVDQEESHAFVVGRATHTLVLEGVDAWNREYAIGGPINPTTNRPFGANTKKFKEWAEQQTKPIVNDTDADLLVQLAQGVADHELAQSLLTTEGHQIEGVLRGEMCGHQVQIRADWYHPEVGLIDLKTCKDLTWFENDARRYGYVYQMAFYRAMLEQELDTKVPVHLIAVEKQEPYRCGVWHIMPDILTAARVENQTAMKRLHRSIEDNYWPGGYEDVRQFTEL